MRLFFSGELPEEQRSLLAKVQERLKPLMGDVKWVPPHNLHITLRFIGETGGKLLPKLDKIGREIGKLYGSFDISLKGLGVFPQKGPPRVLWVGIEEGKKQISMVAQALESRLAKLNIKMEDHEFKPHITLGRLKVARISDSLLAQLAADETSSQSWHFDSFCLKESQLTPSGPNYKNVFTIKLAPKEREIKAKESERWSELIQPGSTPP